MVVVEILYREQSQKVYVQFGEVTFPPQGNNKVRCLKKSKGDS
jgi:hypothetical protein